MRFYSVAIELASHCVTPIHFWVCSGATVEVHRHFNDILRPRVPVSYCSGAFLAKKFQSFP